eukprot:scaffold24_cov341-Pavlova_lutheri.AAC.55
MGEKTPRREEKGEVNPGVPKDTWEVAKNRDGREGKPRARTVAPAWKGYTYAPHGSSIRARVCYDRAIPWAPVDSRIETCGSLVTDASSSTRRSSHRRWIHDMHPAT